MANPAIRVTGLGKRYRLGQTPAADRFSELLQHCAANLCRAPSRWLSRRKMPSETGTEQQGDFWALRDVSFEVPQGEVVGIIGRNGAGKSTLLKILSRITEPTAGRVEIRGRIGSLLEVGTGFHPELSGRENIYLNGALLGMQRSEIKRKFDEIVAFSEIEQFLDTPVKRYSSGMYVRLAFAVAAHLEPEILVVDEVLAVGDAAFQKKCLGKLGEVAEQGRTVLFVSHNIAAVRSLCSRAIWLESGRLREQGAPANITGNYVANTLEARQERIWSDANAAPGNEKVRLRRMAARAADGDVGDFFTTSCPIVLEFEYEILTPGQRWSPSIVVYNHERVAIFNTAANRSEVNWNDDNFHCGLYRSVCRIPGNLLNDGRHEIDLHMILSDATCAHRVERALVFDVHESPNVRRGQWYGKWIGVVRPELRWETELLQPVRQGDEMK